MLRGFAAKDASGLHSVVALAFPSDHSGVIAGFPNGAVLWDMSGGQPLRQIMSEANVFAVAASGDGRRIATADLSGVALWDFDAVRKIAYFRHPFDVRAVTFSPDGQTLASGTYVEGSIRLWSLRSGKLTHRLDGHESGISALAYPPRRHRQQPPRHHRERSGRLSLERLPP